jgi:hypothetical protein
MSRTENFNINFRITDIKALRELIITNISETDINLSIGFEKIESINFEDDSVLVIEYDVGEVRLDLPQNKLENLF